MSSPMLLPRNARQAAWPTPSPTYVARAWELSDGGWRVIYHLSAPPGNSVNDFIDPTSLSLHYCTIDAAIAILNTLGPAWHPHGKNRPQNAFRLIPVRKEVDKCFPPAIFNQLASTIVKTQLPHLIHYLIAHVWLALHSSTLHTHGSHCTLHIVHAWLALHIAHCTLHCTCIARTAHCTLHFAHAWFTLHIALCARMAHIDYCTLHTHDSHCTLDIAHAWLALHTHCTLDIAQGTLHCTRMACIAHAWLTLHIAHAWLSMHMAHC